MADGGYEPLPEEDPDEENPTESESRRTDEGDWTPGRRRGEHRSSSRHQYETRKGSSMGHSNPSYEDDGEERPRPPIDARNVWKEIKYGRSEKMIDIGEEAQEECKSFVDGIYERPDYAKLMFAKSEDGWKMVKLNKLSSVYYVIDDDGKLVDRKSSKVPESLKKALGKTRIETAVALDAEEIEMVKLREDGHTKEGVSERGNRVNEIESVPSEAEIEERLREIDAEREGIVEGMSLREKVKYYFKKYGFTVVGILTAIGAVIGSILSNLKSGLANVAKGVGKGLKDLGAKLAGILPGMIGAIAKFLFDTAGEVVGFLAEHAWVLIVGLVVLVVESLKKKYGRKK